METELPYFEITDAGDLIRIELLGALHKDTELTWDMNWLKSVVTVKGGQFQGKYEAEFMRGDFSSFYKGLKRIYSDLKGSANFNCLEDQLEITFNGDGFGHFEIKCIAMDQPGVGGRLEFTMGIDQTYLPTLFRQLQLITDKFPVIE
ncbi:MAG TPA: hypothetical protein VF691_04500 [Cytophagaceae bacterium]|jgi:hypothetical protein